MSKRRLLFAIAGLLLLGAPGRAQEGYKIIVNLQGVSFMDSTGLGTLVGGLKRVKEHEGVLSLVCSSRPVLRVLSITGLNNVFPIHESVEQAVAAG